MILAIAIVMWWLSAYPKSPFTQESIALQARASEVVQSDPAAAEDLQLQARRFDERAQQAHSFAGKIGGALQPLFAPIGLDRQLTVAVLTSFLAREVFITTVFVLAGAGADADSEDQGTLATIRSATREGGLPLFTLPTSGALLVFFVLAMQCLPTLVVVRRETGSWRWPLLQFGYMSVVAYLAAFVTYRLMS